MKQSIHFMFDNVNSRDMGVHIAWNNKGLFEENFLPERKIIEKKIANREKPYFQRVEHEPLSFNLSFAISDWQSKDTLRKIARWLFQPYYKPLVFDSNPERVFYAMFVDDSTLFHNGVNEGYVELNIRCDSPYGYSHEKTKENIEFKDSNVGVNIKFDINTFIYGDLKNIEITGDGLTVGDYPTTWGVITSSSETWGGIR